MNLAFHETFDAACGKLESADHASRLGRTAAGKGRLSYVYAFLTLVSFGPGKRDSWA
jgi:hypothetical protein